MQRRHFLFLAPLVPAAFFAPRFLRARTSQTPARHNIAEEANRIDELASNIHTPADARSLVHYIAVTFSDELPPSWATDSLRSRIANREYLAVTNPQQRISEEHLASTWNAYMSTLHAPDESHVSAPEIHNLRDALWATARVTWKVGGRNIWAVPSIFATQADGTLAPGCRVVESLRILWDMADIPDNLRAARDRVAKGILVSDLYKRELAAPRLAVAGATASFQVHPHNNPVEAAATQHIRENGTASFTNAVETMLNNLLSA